MATLEQIERALRAADAAGNTEDARRLAQAYADLRRQQAAPLPDFSNVTSGADSYASEPDYSGGREGTGLYGRYMAGVGRSLTNLGAGAKLAGTEFLATGLADPTGLTGASREEALATGRPVGSNRASEYFRRSAQRQRAEYDERRAFDEKAFEGDHVAGFGNIVGTLGSILGPGAALRGTAAAGAFLPRTLAGNAAQGAAIGAIQPLGTDDSRASNALLGGALGAGGYAASAVPAGLLRGAARLSPSVTQGMQERQAADVVRQFAAHPDGLLTAAQNPTIHVPGSMPTLAEVTEDAGLAGLQRTLANLPDFGPQLAQRQAANNTARVRAIEQGFGGADDATAAGIRSQANKRASRMLRPVETTPLESTQAVSDTISSLLTKHRAKPAVRAALEDVRGELANVRTVGDAHGLRQYIGQLMGGNIEGKASGKLAQFELGTVRNVLDRQMRQAFPEWGDFLKGHREAMKQADQATTGADLLATGRAVRDATNDPVLQPASFARAANKISRPQNRAQRLRAGSLTQDQMDTIARVRMDLERQARAATEGKAIGSNTVQNMIGGNTLQSAIGPVGAAAVEPVSGIAMLGINQLRKTYGERTMAVVQEVMLNPDRAAEVLSKLPSKQRQAVMSAIRQLPRATGAAANASIPVVTQ